MDMGEKVNLVLQGKILDALNLLNDRTEEIWKLLDVTVKQTWKDLFTPFAETWKDRMRIQPVENYLSQRVMIVPGLDKPPTTRPISRSDYVEFTVSSRYITKDQVYVNADIDHYGSYVQFKFIEMNEKIIDTGRKIGKVAFEYFEHEFWLHSKGRR